MHFKQQTDVNLEEKKAKNKFYWTIIVTGTRLICIEYWNAVNDHLDIISQQNAYESEMGEYGLSSTSTSTGKIVLEYEYFEYFAHLWYE
jgi:hypothetical protein